MKYVDVQWNNKYHIQIMKMVTHRNGKKFQYHPAGTSVISP